MYVISLTETVYTGCLNAQANQMHSVSGHDKFTIDFKFVIRLKTHLQLPMCLLMTHTFIMYVITLTDTVYTCCLNSQANKMHSVSGDGKFTLDYKMCDQSKDTPASTIVLATDP